MLVITRCSSLCLVHYVCLLYASSVDGRVRRRGEHLFYAPLLSAKKFPFSFLERFFRRVGSKISHRSGLIYNGVGTLSIEVSELVTAIKINL